MVLVVKNPPANAESAQKMQNLPNRCGEDPLEEGMATHSRILAWRTTWTGELGRLQSRGSQRVGHD